jgi:transposase
MVDVQPTSRMMLESREAAVLREGSRAGVACPLASECRDWRYQARYREAMHRRAVEREARLKQEVAELREENRKLRQEVEDLRAELALKDKLLFAPSTEKQPPPDDKESPPGTEEKPRRRRGQQPGSKGHGRRSIAHLPAEPETHDLPEDGKRCPRCGQAFEPFQPDEESEQIEVEVRAYRRVCRRKKYRRTCRCPDTPGIVTAPPPPALIPKGRIGISVWIWILLDKFYLLRPTYRLLKDLAGHGLFLAQGTVTDGLRRLGPLFEPIYLALREKCLTEDHWHADETGWLVFEPTEDGKKGRRRYLWIFHSPSAVFYILDRSRGSEVPRAFFGDRASGIISADRYSAYKSLMKDGLVLVAYCWAHVRRDFLRVRDTRPKYAKWAQAWVDQIGKLYELNDRRLAAASEGGDFAAANEELRLHLLEMETVFEEELAEGPPKARKKVLESLKNHWDGLTLFFGFPEIPPDNNAAERFLRSPVVGRKNYYGSGSEWSGRFASMMFSIIQTLFLWDIEPRKWLTWYLEECARLRGRPPEDIAPFLPWNLSPEEREQLSGKVRTADTS